jgi:hypothetical protein
VQDVAIRNDMAACQKNSSKNCQISMMTMIMMMTTITMIAPVSPAQQGQM